MSTALFLANLALVLLFLGLTLMSGRRGNRELHYGMVISTVLFLFLAIVQAEMIGKDFVFNSLRLEIHLWCAFTALAALPGVIWSGLRLRRDELCRRTHQRWVAGFVLLTLASISTAIWMFLDAVPVVKAD